MDAINDLSSVSESESFEDNSNKREHSEIRKHKRKHSKSKKSRKRRHDDSNIDIPPRKRRSYEDRSDRKAYEEGYRKRGHNEERISHQSSRHQHQEHGSSPSSHHSSNGSDGSTRHQHRHSKHKHSRSRSSTERRDRTVRHERRRRRHSPPSHTPSPSGDAPPPPHRLPKTEPYTDETSRWDEQDGGAAGGGGESSLQHRIKSEPSSGAEGDERPHSLPSRQDTVNRRQNNNRQDNGRHNAASRSQHNNNGTQNGREQWGKAEDNIKQEEEEVVEKVKPNLGLSGKLTEDANTYKGVVIKYSQPAEARKPKRRWRWYIFKGEEELPFLPLHRQSAYLIGRERRVVDVPTDHPSCSKQHAVLQYRLVRYSRDDGSTGRTVKPYIIDLESANGTYVNNHRIEARSYVELLEKDVVKFGYSSREYVLLHETSKDSDADTADAGLDTSPVSALMNAGAV